MPQARLVVLGTVRETEGNPYLRLWNDAARGAGAQLALLTPAAVFARGLDKPAWVHLQWPEWAVAGGSRWAAARRGAKLVVLVAVARVRGARVMLTAHNVWSHERRHQRLEALLWTLLGRLTTDLHVLSAAGRDEFVAAHPTFARAAVREIPHGNYLPTVGSPPSRELARADLGLPPDGRVFVTFGVLRPYKGVEGMVDAFCRLPDPDARLVVAGRVTYDGLLAHLEDAQRSDPRIVLLPRFLSDDEVVRLVRAADAVVLPYRRVLNSGSALLALSLCRPVLLPQTPTFVDLQERVGSRWVRLFEDAVTESELAALPREEPGDQPDLTWCDWDGIGDRLARLWTERRGRHVVEA